MSSRRFAPPSHLTSLSLSDVSSVMLTPPPPPFSFSLLSSSTSFLTSPMSLLLAG